MKYLYPVAIRWIARRWLRSLEAAFLNQQWHSKESVDIDNAREIINIMGEN